MAAKSVFDIAGRLSSEKETTCVAAAESCNRGTGCGLRILQYARENGCEWDNQVCQTAAMRGCLHVIKYAVENGCLWDKERTREIAMAREHFDIVEWIDSL